MKEAPAFRPLQTAHDDLPADLCDNRGGALNKVGFIVLAQLGPKLIGVDLPAACAEYEKQLGGWRP